MSDTFMHRYYTVSRREIAYLRFLVEGYEGLLFLRTLDSREALIEIGYSPSMAEDAGRVLEAICRELCMEETEAPPSDLYPSL